MTAAREPRLTPTGYVPYGLVLPLGGDLSWQADAICSETDPEIFFPEKGGTTKEAKAVCEVCPVRAECLDYALDNGEDVGVWGGTSRRDRRKLLGLDDGDSEEASAA